MNRRQLLATVGSIAGSISVVSPAAAGRQSARGRDRPRPVTVAQNGVVIQLRDCTTARLRGRPHDAHHVIAEVRFFRAARGDRFGEEYDSQVGFPVELPMAITHADLGRALHALGAPPAENIRLTRVDVHDPDGDLLARASVPERWNCGG